MKQTLLSISFLCILLAGAPLNALTQNGNSGLSLNVSAEVIAGSVEIITIQSMNLSQAEVTNERIQINPQTSPHAGKMVAIGTPNSDMRISFLQQRELTQQNGTSTLMFNYEISGNAQDDQSTAEILDRENRDFEFNDEGRFYLWIGGEVDISTADPGNYQGEFTLDIEYI